MTSLVGKKAPSISTSAVVNGQITENFSLEAFHGKKVILFFYPLDFTFVCPTELHAFQEHLIEFQARGVEVIGCSVDSAYSHLAWLGTPKSKGGIEGVSYPLIADLNKSVATSFGVLAEEIGIAYRGLFLIDAEGIVRHQLVNDLPLGRSIPEALRMVDSLNFFEKNGEVCPANWQSGEKAMTPNQEGLETFLAGASS